MDGEIPSMGESEAQEIESQEEAEARESEVKPMTLDIPRVEESASREKGPYQMDVVEKEPGVFRVRRRMSRVGRTSRARLCRTGGRARFCLQ